VANTRMIVFVFVFVIFVVFPQYGGASAPVSERAATGLRQSCNKSCNNGKEEGCVICT
jgi:hypothetical protein